MAQMIEYECPCCGGSIEFDSTIQKMKCPYCDTEFDVEAMRTLDEEMKEKKQDKMDWSSEGNEWSEEEATGMKIYACKSCGGEIIGDDNIGSATCPYCGSNVVMKEQFAGDLKPDFIVPFKLDKRTAKERFKAHLEGKKLLPKCFKDENYLEEIKGMYVPFWVFDTKSEGNIRYKGTKLRVWKSGDYTYTQTSYYDIVREGYMNFKNVPVDGSRKMPDDLMESLEPFDFSQAVEFQPAYLAGYLAERYDVTAEECIGKANARIKRSTEDALAATIKKGYATIIPVASSVNFENAKAKYVLYPVWILNTKWKNKQYTFAMNAQTGKFVGDLPVDRGTYWKYHRIWTGAVAAVLILISLFLGII